MTDDQQEDEMPKLAIDNDRLASAIERQRDKMVSHGDQILTRSEQRLQAEVDRKVELQGQIKEDEAQNADLIIQISRLQALLAKGEDNVQDARIELRGVLALINSMEVDGISLP